MNFFSVVIMILKRFPKRIPVIVILMLISGLSESIGLGLMVPIVEFFFEDRSFAGNSFISNQLFNIVSLFNVELNLVVLFGLFIFFFFVKGIIKFSEHFLTLQFLHYYHHTIASTLYQNIFQLKWTVFQEKKAGSYESLLINETQQAINVLRHTIIIMSETLLLFFYLSLSLLLSWKLTLFIVLFLCFSLIFLKPLFSKTNHLGAHHRQILNDYTSSVSEHIHLIKWIKSSGTQHFTKTYFQHSLDNWAKSHFKTQLFASISPSFFLTFAAIGLSGICYLALVILKTKFSTVLLLLAIFYRALPKFQIIQQHYQLFLMHYPNLAAIDSFVNQSTVNQEQFGQRLFKQLKHSITVSDVSFSYKKTSTFKLSKVSFTIEKNKSIAILGSSGSGKSTLIDLLIGLLHPNTGDILIDNHSLNTYDINSFRSKIGIVTQDILFLNDTILNNLTWGTSSISKQQLHRILKQTHCLEFIKQLDNGLDTVIGDRGIKLSGGQRQRLALARALVNKPDILILDEATNALDAESEAFIHETIVSLQGKLTTIMVSHRLSSVKYVDHIIVMDKGSIIEQGSWKTLTQQKGKFNLFKRLQLLD